MKNPVQTLREFMTSPDGVGLPPRLLDENTFENLTKDCEALTEPPFAKSKIEN